MFFAVLPDPQTAAHIAGVAGRLRSEMHIEAPLLRTGRLHVTLHPLGDFVYVPDVIVARACAAAASIDVPPFPVTFDRILSFNGQAEHWNWVLTGGDGLGQLIDFQQRLGSALRRAGLRVSGARFTPHLTLLYGERRRGSWSIEPITWTVRELVLIHSWLGKTRYDIKGRWPLSGGGVST
ncbi:RNA 2',3'-cyclic phosphodiesterase [Paraburkholderia caffeinitolerans]|uniref:RNA 2',3'-cyclic phosphodiesterase n=1 Tax=Paraburkholderia caffeinitolerans TaxID=1723730 RepID=A0A6J5GZH7_9BURK|nr:RNA 2',3'-cyclic phosphodiesterase [Paraburkholderia caffeinitolerans]